MNSAALATALSASVVVCAVASAQNNLPVSVASSGALANNDSYYSLISADGRYVVFQSEASNLVPNDNNGVYDIFRRDLQTGVTELVSVSTSGNSASGLGLSPAVSGDGRLVLWASNASNIVVGDTNGTWDVFLRDMQAGVTTRISLNSNGSQATDRSDSPRITPDGRFVTFESDADLAPTDNNGLKDCYRLDRNSGQLDLVSVTAAGIQGNGWSYHPQPSDDGQFVCFFSSANTLALGDTNNQGDVFWKNMATGTLLRVNVSSAGVQTNSESIWPSISGDGQIVTFCSSASNLVVGDTGNQWDLFAHDVSNSTTTRLNLQPNGAQANSYVRSPSALSTDGRYVIFASLSTNLVQGDTNGFQDIFVRDRVLQSTERLNFGFNGSQADDDSFVPHMTPDLRVITFTSEATNIVQSDTNGYRDIFATELFSSIGTVYCGPAAANSTGSTGTLAAEGQLSAAANDVTLLASHLPANQFGFFLNSQTQGFSPNPGGSQGTLCLAGAIGRYNPAAGYAVLNSGASGAFNLVIDLANTPTPAGAVTIAAGETWNFQAWYRDLNPGATSNFTDAVSIAFQ